MHIQPFFSHGEDAAQILIFAAIFILCWNLENVFGVTKSYQKWKHDITNGLFILPGAILQFILGFWFVRALLYENANGFGLVKMLKIKTTVGQVAFVFIFLDLVYYAYHYFMHKLKPVWRFHAVHHTDTVLNVSTSLREHPVETCIRLTQYMFFSLLLGPAIWIITLHQFVQIVSKIIIHSNFRIPDHIDKYISMVFITPNMHHVHHHDMEPYTDSNYGDLLSIWDRMFGTFTYLPADKVHFGLDIIPASNYRLDFLSLLKMPFKYRRIFKKEGGQ